MRSIKLLILSLLFMISCSALAVNSPVTLMKNITDKIYGTLIQNKAQLGSSKFLEKIIRQDLLPHIDQNRMAGMVVGRGAWMGATANQRQAFIDEFVTMIVSTYSAALSSFDDDKVKILPLRAAPQSSTAVVHSVVLRSSGQKVPVSYHLVRTGDSWKIYDFSVENISIVQNYHEQFAGVIASNGLAGLIAKMAEHNKRVS